VEFCDWPDRPPIQSVTVKSDNRPPTFINVNAVDAELDVVGTGVQRRRPKISHAVNRTGSYVVKEVADKDVDNVENGGRALVALADSGLANCNLTTSASSREISCWAARMPPSSRS
jgi:hypothetical protein